jgi:hypothetical protein
MSRNRQLYNTLSLMKGIVPSSGFHFSSGNSGENYIKQLQRVQSVTDDWSVERTPINQLGELGEIDRIITTPPTVNFSFDYFVADVSNERKMGFDISGTQSAIRLILNGTEDDSNFFVPVAPEGVDVRGYTGISQVYQLTNSYISSYSVQGQVGSPVTATANYQSLNWATSTGSINVPLRAINPTGGQLVQGINYTIPVGVSGLSNTVPALRPEGISVDIGNGALGLSISDLKIQSFTFGFEIPRIDLTKLGSFFPYSKQINFPSSASASVTAYVGDLTESYLSSLLCDDPSYDITITLRDPSCSGLGADAVKYILKKAKLDSQSFSDQSVGAQAAQVTLNYSVQLTASQTDRGAFISGSRF